MSRKRSLWNDSDLEDERNLSSYRHRELPGETRSPFQAAVKWRLPLGKSWEVVSASPSQRSDWLGLGQDLCVMPQSLWVQMGVNIALPGRHFPWCPSSPLALIIFPPHLQRFPRCLSFQAHPTWDCIFQGSSPSACCSAMNLCIIYCRRKLLW